MLICLQQWDDLEVSDFCLLETNTSQNNRYNAIDSWTYQVLNTIFDLAPSLANGNKSCLLFGLLIILRNEYNFWNVHDLILLVSCKVSEA